MIGIINYGAGNIFSLTAALKRVGIAYGLVSELSDFERYDRFIIPGVGHAAAAIQRLHDSGFVNRIKQTKQPVLGICVGMQLLSTYSEEGNVDLLGLMPLKTLHFDKRIKEKVPHMGWNTVCVKNSHPIFKDIPDKSYFYFVHSYFLEQSDLYTVASCNYGLEFSAAIGKDNFVAVQFHPEKSGVLGETLLRNFANWQYGKE